MDAKTKDMIIKASANGTTVMVASNFDGLEQLCETKITVLVCPDRADHQALRSLFEIPDEVIMIDKRHFNKLIRENQ